MLQLTTIKAILVFAIINLLWAQSPICSLFTFLKKKVNRRFGLWSQRNLQECYRIHAKMLIIAASSISISIANINKEMVDTSICPESTKRACIQKDTLANIYHRLVSILTSPSKTYQSLVLVQLDQCRWALESHSQWLCSACLDITTAANMYLLVLLRNGSKLLRVAKK